MWKTKCFTWKTPESTNTLIRKLLFMAKKNPFNNGMTCTENFLFIGVLVISTAYILLSTYLWYAGAENIIGWNVISNLKESSSTVIFNTSDSLQLAVTEPVFYVKEHYVPTGSKVDTSWWSFIYLTGLLLGTSLVLSATLRLKSLWFMAGIALLGAVLLSFQLELTFNQLNKIPFLVAFFVIALIAYLYNSWIQKNDIGRTLPIFIILFVAFAGVVYKYSVAPLAILQLSNYSVSVGLLLSCLFIFFISHELIGLILKVVSSSSLGNKNTLAQFCVASTIYLLNTVLIYLENSNKIDFSEAVVDPWWIFLLSLVAGFWGFRSFCNQTETFSFKQSGLWLYAGGGLITLATLSYLYATNNNPLIELIADFISISHLVMGVVFFGYVIVNFLQPLRQQLPVHKILYKPPFFRLILVRLVAVFGIFILFAFKNYYSLNQYLAGHYNSLGDYALATNDLFVAETYYKKSVAYDEFNHKGNYSLASLAQSQGDFTTSGFYFNQATKKQPTPFAFAGLSESLLQSNLYFDAVTSIKNGLSTFPNSNQLATNLSQQYAKSNIIDSTFLYADIAYNNCNSCEVESANLLAFWLENAKSDRLDSIYQQFESRKNVSSMANKAAIRKKIGKSSNETNAGIAQDSILSVGQFAWIYNEGTNPNNKVLLNNSFSLEKLLRQPENSGYFSDLTFVKAKQDYLFGDKVTAFQQLNYLTRDESEATTVYDLTLAGWYLNEGLYDNALDYFAKAKDTVSIQNLQLADYESKIDNLQRHYAEEAMNESITSSNYIRALQKAPYNPYIVDKVAEMLINNKQNQRAYQIVFDAVQVNTESLLLWKKYTLISLKMGLVDYASEGLSNVRRLAEPEEYTEFEKQYDDIIQSRADF